MLKYAVSYLSDFLDNLFEDAVKPPNNVTVGGPFEYLLQALSPPGRVLA